MALKETVHTGQPEPQGYSLDTTVAQEAHKHIEVLQEAAHTTEELRAPQIEVVHIGEAQPVAQEAVHIEEVVHHPDQVLLGALAVGYDRPAITKDQVPREVQAIEVLQGLRVQVEVQVTEVLLPDHLHLRIAGLQVALDLLAADHQVQDHQEVGLGADNQNT